MTSSISSRSWPLRLRSSLGFVCLLLGVLAIGGAKTPDDLAPVVADNNVDRGDDKDQDDVAADEPVSPARLVRIPLPIVGDVDNNVIRQTTRALAEIRASGVESPVLVLEFDPGHTQYGAGSDFTRALRLAEYLTSRAVSDVKTVAYLPRSIKGHAVLVAAACQEIVMAADAEIGEAGIDLPADEPVSLNIIDNYSEFARRRGTVPVEIALGMLDRNLTVFQVKTELGEQFVLGSELPEFRTAHTIEGEPREIISQGTLGWFTGREARADRWVAFLADDRDTLARRLEVPLNAVREDPFLARKPKARQFDIKGEIGSRLANSRKHMIDRAVRSDKVNFVCLSIDSGGGDVESTRSLADLVANLPADVRTVAYIDNEARGAAVLLALACDDIVMHKDAVLGGGEPLALDDEKMLELNKYVREHLAPKSGRGWSLPVALLDPKLKVFRYTHRESGLLEYLSPDEVKTREDADHWQQGELVVERDMALAATGDEARQLGLARYVVSSFAEFTSKYELEENPDLAEPSLLISIIRGLADPWMASLLLTIGGVAMIAEMKMPGIGIGGFVAAVCFSLFFWSHYLDGTADALEVILFLVGVTFLLLEIFVIPGWGIFGLGGGALVLCSLILASQTFVLPRSSAEIDELLSSMMMVGVATVGVIGIGSMLSRLLPHAPMFNRVMLEPPSGRELAEQQARESIVSYEHLLGTTGEASTQLTPSGKGRFGEELIDVISEGTLIAAGSQIVVVEVHGNRIIVELAEAS